MMKEETLISAQNEGIGGQERSGFNEEYESLSDHEVADINPFASKHHRPLVLMRSSSNLSTSSSSSPTAVTGAGLRNSSNYSPFDSMLAHNNNNQQHHASSIHRFNSSHGNKTSNHHPLKNRPMNSLLDESRSDKSDSPPQSSSSAAAGSSSTGQVRMAQTTATSGMAGFLEMEEEPLRSQQQPQQRQPQQRDTQAEQVLQEQDDLIDFTPADEPIQTTSGLLLTHRKSSAEKRAERGKSSRYSNRGPFPPTYRPSPTRFEVESSPWTTTAGSHHNQRGRPHGSLQQARRLLSFAKIWVLFFCAVLVIGTGIIFHTFHHRESRRNKAISQSKMNNINNQLNANGNQEAPQQILLVPLNNASELARLQREAEEALQQQQQQKQQGRHGARRLLSDLSDLRVEFESWIVKHGKSYQSEQEKEHRFGVWKDNHYRTIAKNKRHGDCPLMKQPVFGSNHLQDLTTEEFQAQFLTGYNGPNADGHEVKTGRRRQLYKTHQPPVMHRDLQVTRHPTVHRRILRQWQLAGYTSSSRCRWWDVSCWMRVVFQEYLYVGTGTMEPQYDRDAYPTSMDWRDLGAVTDVRRQGDCGACWAITAVETVESAYFIGTGSLKDLSETEVISCTDSCNMCFGGWPQDAYDYIMEHNGVMLSNDWSYDGDTLLALSEEMEAEESELDEEMFGNYISETCPASGSGDQGNDGSTRYGDIKGYGFATDRCVCYSDGSGCDCDNQNEGVAVRNVASYGPATVCLDASVWQDYDGGIIKSSSGCSAKFLAMNHCVQVVGYAYNDGSGGDGDEFEGEGNSGDSGSGSHDSGSGSRDNKNRVGYWIVRNQWSQNWGMNGFAYVAMGENTCGILNDMTQAYM